MPEARSVWEVMRSSFCLTKSRGSAGSACRFGRFELLAQGVGGEPDHGQRLVDLVGDARGHLAEIGQARGVEQADLGQPALRVVDADQHDVAQAAGLRPATGLAVKRKMCRSPPASTRLVSNSIGCRRSRAALGLPARRSDEALEAGEFQLVVGPADDLGAVAAQHVERRLVGHHHAPAAIEHEDDGAGRLEAPNGAAPSRWPASPRVASAR